MCGILGIKFKNNKILERKNDFIELMKQLMIRGKHSFGLCYFDKEFITLKSLDPNFEEFLDKFYNSNSNSFIYHNRYSTSGDYKNMINNQPITLEYASIAMNGVFSMKKKEEYEKEFNIKCISENDTEIILRLMENGINIIDILKENKNISFAGIILLKDSMIAIRNKKRPLYYFETEDYSGFISTKDTIIRSNIKYTKLEWIKSFEMVKI